MFCIYSFLYFDVYIPTKFFFCRPVLRELASGWASSWARGKSVRMSGYQSGRIDCSWERRVHLLLHQREERFQIRAREPYSPLRDLAKFLCLARRFLCVCVSLERPSPNLPARHAPAGEQAAKRMFIRKHRLRYSRERALQNLAKLGTDSSFAKCATCAPRIPPAPLGKEWSEY